MLCEESAGKYSRWMEVATQSQLTICILTIALHLPIDWNKTYQWDLASGTVFNSKG